MDELRELLQQLATAFRSLQAVPGEVAAAMSQWVQNASAAAAAIRQQQKQAVAALQSHFQAVGQELVNLKATLGQAGAAIATTMTPLTSVVKDIGEGFGTVFRPVLRELSLLGSAAADAGRTLKKMGLQAVEDAGKLVGMVGAMLGRLIPQGQGHTQGSVVTGNAFASLRAAVASTASVFSSRFASLSSSIAGSGRLVTSAFGSLATASGAVVSGGLASLASAFGTMAGKFAAFTAALNPTKLMGALTGTHPRAYTMGNMAAPQAGIFSALLGPFQQLSNVAGSFVQTLNPGLMKMFNHALRNLYATIGVALAPVITHLSALFNALSATLAPAMHALEPIVDNLMSVLEGTLVPVVGIIADAFVALSPVIEFITSAMASLSEAMRVVYTVFRSAIQVLWDVLKQVFAGMDLKGAASQFQQVIHQLTKYFVQFAAYIAKALGYLDPFAKALEKNLRDLEGQKPGAYAAPENVHTSNLQQISKDIATAAFSAMGAGGARKKSEAEFLEELIKEVKAIKTNGKTLEDFLTEMREKVIAGFLDDLNKIWAVAAAWLLEHIPGAKTVDTAREAIKDAGRESERARRIQDHAMEMRRRGMNVSTDAGHGFWFHLADEIFG